MSNTQAVLNTAGHLLDLIREAHSTTCHADDTRANRLLTLALYQLTGDAAALHHRIAELNEANQP